MMEMGLESGFDLNMVSRCRFRIWMAFWSGDFHRQRGSLSTLAWLAMTATFSIWALAIAILASNLRDNIDDAFARRFESVIYFPLPRPEEREQLWRQGFSPKARFAGDLDLAKIARDYTLSGGSIMNVIRLASLQSLKENGRPIGRDDLVAAIRTEMIKEGRAA